MDDREEKLGKQYVAINKDGDEIFRLIRVRRNVALFKLLH